MKGILAEKFSIIVSSSDGYDDCWDPFFTLLKLYFPGIEKIEILLSTQTKDYSNPFFNLKVVKHGSKAAWSQRLKQTLKQSSHDIILFLDEDSFLRSTVNVKLLDELLELMVENEKISHIRLIKTITETAKTEYKIIEEIIPGSKNRFTTNAGLWKKDIFYQLLADHESTWQVEKWGNFRANIMKKNFYCVSKNIVEKDGPLYNTSVNGGIYKGKWIESYVVPLFKENDILVNFTKRGFYNQKDRLLSRVMIYVKTLLHPVSTLRSIITIISFKLFWKEANSN